MRIVLQRVSEASVTVDGAVSGEIARGVLVLVGVGKEDDQADADYLADKIVNLRIFSDNEGKMNLSLLDVGGHALVVSQFTLLGNCAKGRRPSFDQAAAPARANELYEYLIYKMRESGIPVSTGVFQAHMEVRLLNDGPVTFVLESRSK